MPEPSSSANIAGPALAAGRRSRSTASLSRWLSGWPLAIAALAACWLLFFSELRGEWSINPQYNYGYVVPLLGAMLVWRRWPERPAASPKKSAAVMVTALISLFFLLPLQLILEANPEWRLVYWMHGFLALVLSGCLLYHAGGWNWVKFFTPPLAFMLIAIPWPMGLEQAVTQNLMRWVAGLTVEVAGWLGIPAVQHGNLIEVGAGMVGINEACSGVRSLQCALMLSLFLGEMHRFPFRRRVFLIGASLGCVLFANLTRTSFLTWAAANRGIQQMEAWHDTAGILVMGIVLPCLFGLAHWVKPKTTGPAGPPAGVASAPGTMPRWAAVGVFAWIGTTSLVTEAWYRAHERKLVDNARWSVAWPSQAAHFKKTALPEESLTILRCSISSSADWEDDEGDQWSAFFLRWNAGRNSTQLAKGHRPDICFPAAGAKLVSDRGQISVNANGIDLPFKYQTFESGPRLLHVFYCLWSDRLSPGENSLVENGSIPSRLQAVLAGKRNLGQEVFEVVITGPETSEAAVALFQQQLPRLIQRTL